MVSPNRPNILIFSSAENWMFLSGFQEQNEYVAIERRLEFPQRISRLEELLKASTTGKEVSTEIVILVDSADCLVVETSAVPKLASMDQMLFQFEEVLPLDAEDMQPAIMAMGSSLGGVVIDKRPLEPVVSAIQKAGITIKLIAPLASFLLQASGQKPNDDQFVLTLFGGQDRFEFVGKKLTAWRWSGDSVSGIEEPNNGGNFNRLDLNIGLLSQFDLRKAINNPWISFHGKSLGTQSIDYGRACLIALTISACVALLVVNSFIWHAGSRYYAEGRQLINLQQKIAKSVVPETRARVDVERWLRTQLVAKEANSQVVGYLSSVSQINDLGKLLEIISEEQSCELNRIGIQNGRTSIGGTVSASAFDTLTERIKSSGFVLTDSLPAPTQDSSSRTSFSLEVEREGK